MMLPTDHPVRRLARELSDIESLCMQALEDVAEASASIAVHNEMPEFDKQEHRRWARRRLNRVLLVLPTTLRQLREAQTRIVAIERSIERGR